MGDEMCCEETVSMPRLGEAAPNFKANTTQGPIKLSDLKGSWVILFSHPADFTPVCTTEFMAFAKLHDEFVNRNCKVIGLSIDSLFSHIAWVRDIEQMTGVKIPFPVIEDLSMKVSRAYGMVQPAMGDTHAVRAVFFIDPEGIMRAMIYYPPSTGRNFAEILRVLDSLQLVDREKVATPADWQPGEKVIVPPPRTAQEAEERMQAGYECEAWYLCRREV